MMLKVNLINPVSFNSINFLGSKRRTSQDQYEPYVKPYIRDSFERNPGKPLQESSSLSSKEIPVENQYQKLGIVPSQIYAEAERPYQNFKIVLEQYLEDLITDEHNHKRPIGDLIIGRKSPQSIAEKMRTKGMRSKKAALNGIDDLIRARVILNTGTSKEGDEVVDRLIKAAKQGKVKIVEITSYRPEKLTERKKYEYVRTAKLRELAETIRKQGQDLLTKGEEKESGYLAVHIIFELQGGYKAELQIMGKDIERLKAIEDICFKIKCNKKVDPKYNEVVAAIKKIKKDKNLMNEYNLYTKAAYKFERLKPSNWTKLGGKTEMLRLDSENLPKILDFNKIAYIMDYC